MSGCLQLYTQDQQYNNIMHMHIIIPKVNRTSVSGWCGPLKIDSCLLLIINVCSCRLKLYKYIHK